MYKNREQFVASPDTETKRTHIDKLQLVLLLITVT